MDIVQKSISAIQQVAASLGKRITSNFNWAGQQAQQNIVKPVQQAVSTAGRSIGQGLNQYDQTVTRLSQNPNPIISTIPKGIINTANAQIKQNQFLATHQNPSLSMQGAKDYLEYEKLKLNTNLNAASTVAPLVFGPATSARTFIGAGAMGAAFSGGAQMVNNARNEPSGNVATLPAMKRLVKGVPSAISTGAQQGVMQAPAIGAVSDATNPYIYKAAGKILAKFPTLSETGKDIVSRVVQGFLSVPQGMAMAKATGQDYNMTSAAIDFAVGSGLAKKVGDIAVDGPYNQGQKGFVATKDFKRQGDMLIQAIDEHLPAISDSTKNKKFAIEDFGIVSKIKESLLKGVETPEDLHTLHEIFARNNIKVDVYGGSSGFAKLNEPVHSTEPVLPATKKDVANYAKLRQTQKVKAGQLGKAEEHLVKIMETNTDKFASTKADKNIKTLMSTVFDQTEAGIAARIKMEKDALSGLPEGGAKQGPVIKQNVLQVLRDDLLKRSKYVMESMGVSGKALAQKIDRIYENSEIRAGNYVADLKDAYKGVLPDRVEAVNRYLDGQDVQLNPTELGTANKVRKVLDSVVSEGQKAGLQEVLSDGSIIPLQKRDNYFTQVIDTNKLKQFEKVVVEHLVTTKQFESATAAEAFVKDLINGETVYEAYNRNKKTLPTGRMGNLEFARTLDLPSIVRRYDKDVLGEYVSRASHRIETATEFGSNSERLNYLIDSIAKEGHDFQKARDIAEAALGLGSDNTALRKGIGQIKQLQSLTKLGLGAITNVGQTVNTAAVTGFKNTLGAISDNFTPQGKEYAERTGVVLSDSLQQFTEESLGKGFLSKITAPGFRAVERFNRVVSANAGRRYVEELLNNIKNNPNDTKSVDILKKYIGDFSVEKVISDGLNDKQLQTAGSRMTNTTQFKVRTWDMPKGWRNPWVNLAVQFKSFAYNQSEFMAKEILAPAVKGNAAPMVRFVVAGMVLGELLQDTKALLRFRDRPTDLKERLMDNISSVGGFGLVGDVINSASRGPEALMKWIAGPTISDVANLAGGVGLATQGKPKTITRLALGQIPIVGPSIANAAMPPQGAYKARTPDLIQEGIGITTSTELPSKLSDDPVIKREQIKQLQSSLDEEKQNILNSQEINIFGNRLMGMSEEEKSQKIQQINLQKELLQEEPKITKLLELSEATNPQKVAKEYKLIQYANTVINNADLSQDTKAQIISRLGVDYKKAIYYNEASMPTEVKEMMINEKINELISSGKGSEVAQFLASQRQSVAGKMMLSDTILNKLASDGTISYALKDVVKNTSVDSNGNFTSKVKASKPKSLKAKKIAIRKVKAAKAPKSAKIKSIKVPKFKALKTPKIKKIGLV